MIHEHFAETLAPTVHHQVRHTPHLPRSFVCSEGVADEMEGDIVVERLFGNHLFITDQIWSETSPGYTFAMLRHYPFL
jgi:hypothetical protein